MALPGYIQKTLVMKPEVEKIFDDLEAWLDHCRFNLINFDQKDLYKSSAYKEWTKESKRPKNFNRAKKPKNG